MRSWLRLLVITLAVAGAMTAFEVPSAGASSIYVYDGPANSALAAVSIESAQTSQLPTAPDAATSQAATDSGPRNRFPAPSSAPVVGAEAAGASGRSVDEVLNGLPKEKGNQSFVRTAPNEGSLQSTFDELTQGGTPTSWKGYDGSVYELPDGTQIGMRSSSTSGGATIDIRYPDGSRNKIHIAP